MNKFTILFVTALVLVAFIQASEAQRGRGRGRKTCEKNGDDARANGACAKKCFKANKSDWGYCYTAKCTCFARTNSCNGGEASTTTAASTSSSAAPSTASP